MIEQLIGDQSGSTTAGSRVTRRSVLAAAAGLAATLVAGPVFAAKAVRKPPATMLPISITSVTQDTAGNLVANGTVGSHAFTAPLTLTPNGVGADGCPILDLSLAPIHLNLLGLIVDTSAICLNISANPAGGLLGQLLCDVANLLNNGGLLANILNGLNNLQTLLDGLTGLLNGALGAVTSPATTGQTTTVTGTTAGACDILDLSLGPVNLNLLGLVVKLDNCANGPVTVKVTANPARGLLGQLLCNLANLLNQPANGNGIAQLLTQIANVIQQLVNAV
jgi:hypothetical protein